MLPLAPKLYQHCYTCPRREEECELGKLCTYGKKTLKHVAQCKKDDCSYPRCMLLKPLLQHSRRCQSPTCAICVPVWNYIQKETQQPPQQQPAQQPQPQRAANQAGTGTSGNHAGGDASAPAATGSGSGAASAASSRSELVLTVGGDTSGSAAGSGGGAASAKPSSGFAGAPPPKPTAQHAHHRPPHQPTVTTGLSAGAQHRVLAVAPGGAVGAVPPYNMSSYNGGAGLTAALAAQLDVTDRSKVTAAGGHGGSTPTAAATAAAAPVHIPIPIPSNRAGGLAAAPGPAAGHSPMVHSYPPSGALGTYVPHLMQHPMPHGHSGGVGGPGPAAGPAVAAHWLPLTSLTTPSGPVAGGMLAAAPPGSAAAGAAPPGAAMWTAQQIRPGGHLTLYGMPSAGAADGVRPGGMGGHPYALAGAGGLNGGAFAVGPPTGQLLLWPPGHGPPGAAAAPGGGAVAQGSSPVHIPAHLAAQFAVAPPASGSTRLNGGGGVSSGHALSSQAMAGHAVLGPALFATGQQQGMGGGGASSGNGGGAGGLPAELPSGTALWSYVLR
ncbi:hypothetical protein GPECTOR_7g940 [Gonium pectorale]|uniref:histone acetyltransferase n=1 Tax=Gonium pectorale TaxID=33097 RepID=A0A150GVW2_GONPE|nr:hypothetical protein GPECTOR_7g940 [Gonium pectorale]|eukprot:KXZ53490.1 hypothetical protein GPECTOR_7g940 [Gonium pectorale]